MHLTLHPELVRNCNMRQVHSSANLLAALAAPYKARYTQVTASALGRKTMFSSMSARTADEAEDGPDDGPSSARKTLVPSEVRSLCWGCE